MTSAQRGLDNGELAHSLVEELLRTGLSVIDVLSSLLDDLPENAFPGEDPAAVLIEMVAGSSRPAIDAAGETGCRTAIKLIEGVREAVLRDLRAALESKRRDDQVLL